MRDINKNTPTQKRDPETPRRPKSRTNDHVAAPLGHDIPHWIPNDDRWQKIPEAIREAVPRIIAPAYRRFVLEARDELERTVGLTLVHFTWLELCEQVKLAVAAADPTSLDAMLHNPEDMLERHFRLATIKCQTAELLMKLQIVQNALHRSTDNAPLSSTAALPSPLPPGQSPDDAYPPFPLPPEESPGEIGSPPPSPLPLGEGQGEGRPPLPFPHSS
jgi:hypothetical protein